MCSKLQSCVFFCLALLTLSCGYRACNSDFSSLAISVPYIAGDAEAWLNNELVYQLSKSGCFVCEQTKGDYILQVKILSDGKERIGFRYDRDNPAGKLEKNLLGVEDRRTIVAQVSLLESGSGKVVMGPSEVSASVEFDYTDPGSPRDLLFAKHEPIMPFSLGQLDSEEGASDDAAKPLFRKLAQQIVMGLITHREDIKK